MLNNRKSKSKLPKKEKKAPRRNIFEIFFQELRNNRKSKSKLAQKEKSKLPKKEKKAPRRNISEIFFQKINLGTRLFILFVFLLLLTGIGVGYSSYTKAKDMNMESIENRLVRETELMGFIAENLNFVYVSDKQYFMQQLEANVRSQQKKLEEDGISADFFYLSDQQITPFKVSKNSIPSFSEGTIKKITESKNSVLHEIINGEEYTITFQEMKEINGIYALVIPTKSFMGPVYQMALFTTVVILISVIVTTVLSFLFVRTLTKPLNSLRKTMREVREGNLQHAVEIHTTIPEINSLHKSYNAMIVQMREMLQEIKETTNQLENTGGDLKSSSENALTSSQQLVTAINVVRSGAEQTASSSENSVTSFKSMTGKIEDMIEDMEKVFASSNRMDLSAKRGEKNIGKLISMIQTFENDFDQLNNTIKHVKEYSISITNLAQLVNGIAEQTKLLALNATIEAARAGEAGRGFAVVANEVRNLAEKSTIATEEITRSITNMENITINASQEFEHMLAKIQSNLHMANESKISFDELMHEISGVSGNLQGVQGELKHLETHLPQLEEVVNHFSSISQETLASAEEMLAASENQIQQMESTNVIGLKLNGLAKSLSNTTQRFRVD